MHGYKILHRLLVTNKELKKFKIRNDDLCDQCKTPDSLEHTFLQCPANVKFYHEILSWFNVSHNTLINLSPEQILMQKYIPGPINDNLRRRRDLLILFIKKYVYSCKVNVVPLNPSSETQEQSVGSGKKAGRKFSSTGERAPGYRLSPTYFQKFKRMPAPDWAQKMLCIIVPNRRTVSPEFFS